MKLMTLRRVRYSVRSLLAVAALVAVALYWVTWPRMAAEDFVAEHYSEESEFSNPFREGTEESLEFEANYNSTRSLRARTGESRFVLAAHRRTILDLLLSRQTFDYGLEEFTICRGKVVEGPVAFWGSYHRFYR